MRPDFDSTPRRDLTRYLDNDGQLRLATQRAAQAAGKDIPEAARMIGAHLLDTLGLIPDPERAERYRELGQLLIQLGEAYQLQADQLDPPTVEGTTVESPDSA